MVMGNSLWHLVWQSDRMSQLVILALLILSIICWTVFAYKVILFRVKRRHITQALEQLGDAHDLNSLVTLASACANTIPGYFLTKNLAYVKTLLQRRPDGRLTASDSDLLQQHIYQTVDTIVANEESYIPIITTTAVVSPLLGLFGTVWGLIHAFVNISERQSADIATVAPGIAEALITTLAGLMVAIPALALANYLLKQVRDMEKLSMRLADKVSLIVQTVLMP
jgi:biopolymer transport protein TolQ